MAKIEDLREAIKELDEHVMAALSSFVMPRARSQTGQRGDPGDSFTKALKSFLPAEIKSFGVQIQAAVQPLQQALAALSSFTPTAAPQRPAHATAAVVGGAGAAATAARAVGGAGVATTAARVAGGIAAAGAGLGTTGAAIGSLAGLGAAAGAVAVQLATSGAVFVGLTAGAAAAAMAIQKFATSVFESNRHMAEFSGAMGAVIALQDVRTFRRNMEVGNRTAGSAKLLADALDGLADSTKEVSIFFQNMKNLLGAGLAKLGEFLMRGWNVSTASMGIGGAIAGMAAGGPLMAVFGAGTGLLLDMVARKLGIPGFGENVTQILQRLNKLIENTMPLVEGASVGEWLEAQGDVAFLGRQLDKRGRLKDERFGRIQFGLT